MNLVLWIAQIVLCIKLLDVVRTHGLGQSRQSMQTAIRRLGKYTRPGLFFISAGACAAALGLTLPGVLHAGAQFIPLAAIFSAALLLVSLICHIQSREKPKIFVSLVLFAIAVFIAYGRWELLSA
jgi:hypothetical protein